MTEREKIFGEHYQRGLALIQEGKDDEGMSELYAAAKAAPEGWLALANQLIKEGMHGVAAERCLEILKLTKDAKLQAAALNNLGMIECVTGNTHAARDYFRKSLDVYPAAPDAYSNMGLLSQWEGNFKEAVRYASRALSIDHWHEQAAFIRSMCLLMDCDYLRGFEEYECRWRSKTNNLAKLSCDKPEWNGEAGKRVFVYGEQGIGDTILSLRYAAEIRKRGCSQIWVVHKGLEDLLRAVPEIDQVSLVGDSLPDFDCHIPAVSLPRVFKTTVETIPPAPYIGIGSKVARNEQFTVGIVWRGSKAQTNDAIRSTNLALWKPVFDVPGVRFVSLQVDGREEALLYPSIEQGEPPKDWMETIHKMISMDLIISVDTSIVHMAGALGLPCWCALHARPYFVYPPSHGDKTPWYSSVKLYRQDREHNWQPVFERIANDLRKMI